jgi:asparagine synthase (glutamine-hydrolysing)
MFVACASTVVDQISAQAARWRRETEGTAGAWSSSDRFMGAMGSAEETRAIQADGRVVFGRARLETAAGGANGGHGLEASADGRNGLARVAEACTQDGFPALKLLTGAFGVVIWDPTTRTLSAIRDPLGLAPLYYRTHGHGIYFSDRPDVFPESSTFDVDFIAEFIGTGGAVDRRTIWSGVLPVPAGCTLTWANGQVRCEPYWSAAAIRQDADMDAEHAGREFGRLFRGAVLACLEPGHGTWADLSGGLDSSSVVAAAATYGEESRDRVLGGTVTYTDALGGDESRFVDAVLDRFPLRNVRLRDAWPWSDDGAPPPETPLPARDYAFYARDRQVAGMLRKEGARALLSGVGPDSYMPFATSHIPDLLANGRIREAGQEAFTWAYVRGQSIWRVLLQDVLLLYAPARVQTWWMCRQLPIPRWLRRDFTRRHGFAEHWVARGICTGRPGDMSQTRIASDLSRVSAGLLAWRVLPGIELRHPFLSRPLVELCLRLPETVRTNIGRSKPVLRTAMQNMLPAEVLRRQCTKGTTLAPRICWAFRKERARLSSLLESSVLADLGCVEPKAMMADLDNFASGTGDLVTSLYTALSLETWLSSRTGRYMPTGS